MLKKIYSFILLIILLLLILPTNSKASNTGYKIIIEDDADLLPYNEEIELKAQMIGLTEFGNVVFKTTNTSTGSVKPLKYIQNYYYKILGNESGVAFYIDMNSRQICACATGGLDKIITSGKCDMITDNVYKYASNGNYYECAKEAFTQMNTLLNGGKIAESMKYICNAFVAVMLSLLITYGVYIKACKNKKASANELTDECEVSFEHTPIKVALTGEHKVYSPVSSSSGGSSGGGGRRRWRRLLWKRRQSRILS